MVRRGVCVCAHDDVRGRVCAGVVSTSSSTATFRGKESPGDILGTDHERQPSTNQLEEFDPCFGDERFGVNQNPPVKQRKYEELCGRK